MAAFDNFDHIESTLSGIGSSHDTVAVVFQEKDGFHRGKPNVSETNVVHGPKAFYVGLHCQKLQSFIKPAIRPLLPDDFHLMNCPQDKRLLYNEKKKGPNLGLISATFWKICGNQTIHSKGSFLEWCECHLVK